VKIEDKALPGPNINERVRAGKATLVEPVLTKAHQVVAETLSGSQPHDPNAIQFADGSWGTIVHKEDSTKMVLPVTEKPSLQTSDDFEKAVNENHDSGAEGYHPSHPEEGGDDSKHSDGLLLH